MAPQSTTRNGLSRRGLPLWIASAETSLPVPVSPSSRMVASLFDALPSTSNTACIAGDARPCGRSDRPACACGPCRRSRGERVRCRRKRGARPVRTGCHRSGHRPLPVSLDRRPSIVAKSHAALRSASAGSRGRSRPASGGDGGGAQQARLGVGDHVGGHALDQRVQAALAVERLAEPAPLQERQDARARCRRRRTRRRSPAPSSARLPATAPSTEQKKASAISQTGSVPASARCEIAAAGSCPPAAEDGGRLGANQAAAGRLLGQEREHVDQALAGEDTLGRHAPVLAGQKCDQPVLQRRAGREVDVAALRRNHLVAVPGRRPEQECLAEARPGAEHRHRPVRGRRTAAQPDQLVGSDGGDAQRRRVKSLTSTTRAIPSFCASASPSTTQGRLVARQMLCSIGPAMPKQPLSDAGAGADLARGAGQELLGDHVQRRVRGGRVGLLEDRLHAAQPGGRHVVDRQPGIGAADVACQDRHAGEWRFVAVPRGRSDPRCRSRSREI